MILPSCILVLQLHLLGLVGPPGFCWVEVVVSRSAVGSGGRNVLTCFFPSVPRPCHPCGCGRSSGESGQHL